MTLSASSNTPTLPPLIIGEVLFDRFADGRNSKCWIMLLPSPPASAEFAAQQPLMRTYINCQSTLTEQRLQMVAYLICQAAVINRQHKQLAETKYTI